VANGLLNNLIAYWPGDEANGDLLDAHTNALDLTDTNTVTSAAGLVYAGARQYTAANAERHGRAGDDALLSAGDVDLTIATWVLLDSDVTMYLLGKALTEYVLEYSTGTDRFRLRVRDAALTYTNLPADTFGAPATGTWYLIIAGHDAAANTIYISIDDGALDSTAIDAGGILDGAGRFAIGANVATSATATTNGRIGPTAIWKSAAGAGGKLTSAQRTALYNAGAGLTYAAFDTGVKIPIFMNTYRQRRT
jgi:hypothetical protein